MRRLILKRCIYGVDISPMAVEGRQHHPLARLLRPGLALSWLDGNLKCGNSLIGVADPDVVAPDTDLMFTHPVREAMDAARELHLDLQANLDITPDDVRRNRDMQDELDRATQQLRTVFDSGQPNRWAWTTRAWSTQPS